MIVVWPVTISSSADGEVDAQKRFVLAFREAEDAAVLHYDSLQGRERATPFGESQRPKTTISGEREGDEPAPFLAGNDGQRPPQNLYLLPTDNDFSPVFQEINKSLLHLLPNEQEMYLLVDGRRGDLLSAGQCEMRRKFQDDAVHGKQTEVSPPVEDYRANNTTPSPIDRSFNCVVGGDHGKPSFFRGR